MYVKLVVRSLWRHQKRGRKLFALLGLCSSALIVLLTFQSNFETQYRDLFIGLKTGHLQVLPSQSPVFSSGFGARDQEVPLFDTDSLDAWVLAQPEVEAASPVIGRGGAAYNLDSEAESWVSLVAVPAQRRDKLFPLAKVLDGSADLSWKPGDAEVPMLHARLQGEFGQKNPDHTVFVRKELKLSKTASLEPFKTRLAADFPQVFSAPVKGPDADAEFFRLWSAALVQKDLYKTIPPERLESYDYKIDDAVTAIQANQSDSLIPFLNKRLFQALYPDDIGFVEEPIVPGKSVTLQIPGLQNEGALSLPKILPARYAGMVDIMPLYVPDSFLDLEAFRHFAGVAPSLATAYVIRLHSIGDTAAFKARLEAWIAAHESAPLRVADYQFLGKLYLTTSMAFVIIIDILIGVFILIVGLFIVNLVLLSLVQRRAEIGTGIAMGLTNNQTMAVMLGEIAILVTVSWLGGVLAAIALNAAAGLWGIPGMIFFPGQRLYLVPQWGPFIQSYLLLLPASLLAALLPLLGLRNQMPVEFFREAR